MGNADRGHVANLAPAPNAGNNLSTEMNYEKTALAFIAILAAVIVLVLIYR